MKKRLLSLALVLSLMATCLAFALVISLFDWVVSSLLNLVLSI